MARFDAIGVGIKLPEVSSSLQHFENYAVFVGDEYYEYNACCAFDARASGIYDFIESQA